MKQKFNIRNGGSWLGTIEITSKTDIDETAVRLQSYIARRFGRSVGVHPIIN